MDGRHRAQGDAMSMRELARWRSGRVATRLGRAPLPHRVRDGVSAVMAPTVAEVPRQWQSAIGRVEVVRVLVRPQSR